MNCLVFDGFLVPNLESGEIVSSYETPSLHDIYHFSSLVRLGFVDPLGLGDHSPGSFPYAMSELDFPREVAGYGPKHCNCRKDWFAESLRHHQRPSECAARPCREI